MKTITLVKTCCCCAWLAAIYVYPIYLFGADTSTKEKPKSESPQTPDKTPNTNNTRQEKEATRKLFEDANYEKFAPQNDSVVFDDKSLRPQK